MLLLMVIIFFSIFFYIYWPQKKKKVNRGLNIVIIGSRNPLDSSVIQWPKISPLKVGCSDTLNPQENALFLTHKALWEKLSKVNGITLVLDENLKQMDTSIFHMNVQGIKRLESGYLAYFINRKGAQDLLVNPLLFDKLEIVETKLRFDEPTQLNQIKRHEEFFKHSLDFDIINGDTLIPKVIFYYIPGLVTGSLSLEQVKKFNPNYKMIILSHVEQPNVFVIPILSFWNGKLLTDVTRKEVIVNYIMSTFGGFFLDESVICIRNFDGLLSTNSHYVDGNFHVSYRTSSFNGTEQSFSNIHNDNVWKTKIGELNNRGYIVHI